MHRIGVLRGEAVTESAVRGGKKGSGVSVQVLGVFTCIEVPWGARWHWDLGLTWGTVLNLHTSIFIWAVKDAAHGQSTSHKWLSNAPLDMNAVYSGSTAAGSCAQRSHIANTQLRKSCHVVRRVFNDTGAGYDRGLGKQEEEKITQEG